MGRHHADPEQPPTSSVPPANGNGDTVDYGKPLIKPASNESKVDNFDDDDDDLLEELNRRRAETAVNKSDTTVTKEKKRPLINGPNKVRLAVLAVGLAACAGCLVKFTHTGDGGNPYNTKPLETNGPNMLPENPIEGVPMDTVADRTAAVQRAVNSGDYGKTVDVMPGTLSFENDGEAAKLRNPIIVMDGLEDKYQTLASGDPDLTGHIFAIEPASYDPTAGVGESYKVIAIDPDDITAWKPAPGTETDMPVEAKVGWNEDQAGEAIDPDTDRPYRQGKNNIVIDSDSTKGAPMVVGKIQ